jgi:Tfp pilus assembly protein PilF
MTGEPKNAPDGSRRPFGEGLAACLLVLAVVLAYAGSMEGPFVFDDVPAILQNPSLRHPGALAGVLAPPGDQAGSVGGRPIVNLSLAANYALGGTRVWGYHATNLAIHAAAALLLFGIIRRTLAGAGTSPLPAGGLPWMSPWSGPDGLLIAFLASLLWAVHPLQTEAVTYVVQRAESLMGLFYLLTLYCFVRCAGRDPARKAIGRTIWGVLCVLACLLGMATKEVMVSAPLAVLLYDRTFVAGSLREAWRRRRGLYAGLFSTWLLLAVLVSSTHGRGGSAGFDAPAGVLPYALTQCRAVVHYLRLAFWPDRLVFDYGTALVRNPGDVVGQVLLIALLLAGTLYAARRRPEAGFPALCFFALLAPSSSFVPVATEPMAEHRMYLPLAAVSVLTVAAAYAGLSRLAPRHARALLCALCAAAALGLGAATVRRNIDYRSEVALWSDTVRKAPENPRAHNNLAEAFQAGGEPGRAAGEFAAAVRADPDYAPAQYNLGVTLLDSGRPGDAVAHLEKALSAPRHQAELHVYLGEAHERMGQNAEAAEQFSEALRIAPGNSEAAFGLGNNLAIQGRYAEAVDAFRLALARTPGGVRIRNNLGNALMLLGRVDEAVEEYREALRRNPEDASIRDNLERALSAKRAGRP